MNLTQHGHTFTVTTENDLLVLIYLLESRHAWVRDIAVDRFGVQVAA